MKSHICAALCCLLAVPPLVAQQPADHQRTAAAALKAQLSKEGHDCPDAKTQYDQNICLDKVEETTKKDFNTFYRSLQALLGTGGESAKGLDAAQERWSAYVAKSCDAIDNLYRGGSIQPSAVTRCRIALTRSRMRDLDELYSTVLHN